MTHIDMSQSAWSYISSLVSLAVPLALSLSQHFTTVLIAEF